MDPKVNPEPNPKPHDIAQPGPIDPATGQPNHQVEVTEVKSWLRQNATGLVVTAIIIALVFKFWDPFTALKVALGLGFIIFIHELGHFLTARRPDMVRLRRHAFHPLLQVLAIQGRFIAAFQVELCLGAIGRKASDGRGRRLLCGQQREAEQNGQVTTHHC